MVTHPLAAEPENTGIDLLGGHEFGLRVLCVLLAASCHRGNPEGAAYVQPAPFEAMRDTRMPRKFDKFAILLGSMLLLRVSVFLLQAWTAGSGPQDASSSAASASPPTASSPSTSVSPPAPPQAQQTVLDFENLNKTLACFALDDYQDAKRDSDPKAAQYASEVQETASEIKDPQWAEVVTLPAEEAMKRLAALCKEVHYQE